MRHQLIDAAQLKISKHIGKCNYMTITHVDWSIFLVKLIGEQWTVNMLQKTCTCKKFQLDYLPCSHTLAAAREQNLDYTSLGADYYKRETHVDAYSLPIMPVEHHNT
ncbi:hypothetical protein Dsin_021858 [Dipteronia sinensis]|uniref:SWIM-type domain-containing protein n=1 Tax=Dipteronia sinensis TaxID=43782 RepID=A0AAE0DZ74_9ROSI|nr:hypothetical protein Dsin_021858 [Dipteronia sinensis]